MPDTPDADIEAAVVEANDQFQAQHYVGQLEEAGVAAENVPKLAAVVQGKRATVRRAGA